MKNLKFEIRSQKEITYRSETTHTHDDMENENEKLERRNTFRENLYTIFDDKNI